MSKIIFSCLIAKLNCVCFAFPQLQITSNWFYRKEDWNHILQVKWLLSSRSTKFVIFFPPPHFFGWKSVKLTVKWNERKKSWQNEKVLISFSNILIGILLIYCSFFFPFERWKSARFGNCAKFLFSLWFYSCADGFWLKQNCPSMNNSTSTSLTSV